MIASRPVAAFILLAFGISYLLGVPLLAFASGAIPPDQVLLRSYAPRLLIVYGPGIAALVMAGVAGPGVRVLLAKLIPTRDDIAVAVTIVAIGTTTAGAALLVNDVAASEAWTIVRGNAGVLAAHVVLQLLVIATGEELGWRGWLLPVLAARGTRIRATLVTAVVWTLWHGPRLFEGPRVVATFAVSLIALSLIFTWLWSRARHRLFSVIVAHATVNAPVFFWEQARAGHGAAAADMWMTIYSVYAAIAVALLLFRWRWWNGDEAVTAPPARITV